MIMDFNFQRGDTMKKSWSSITVKFPIERDCLASYVAWQAAEVLMGVKPANLVNVTNRTLPCGRNLATLWDDHNAEVLSLITIEAYQLHKIKSNKLVLF